MGNKVRLINRSAGYSHAIFAVSGKSGKLYGHASPSPDEGGMVFEMDAEQYERDKFDIVGNTAVMQQWVPQFVEVPDEFNGVKWSALVQMAKAKGINTFGKNRTQLEEALTG